MAQHEIKHFWHQAEVSQDSDAQQCMPIHNQAFHIRETCGLQQNGVANADFSDIMQIAADS